MLAVSGPLRTRMRLVLLVIVLVLPGVAATTLYTVNRNEQIAFSTAAEVAGADTVRPTLLALADATAGGTPDLTAVHRAAHIVPGLGLAR
ncbi:MAG: hypothetical protein ABW000_15940 [Actinoplanes sp.]